MTLIKKGIESYKADCQACKLPITLTSIRCIVGSMESKCPWCNKMLHVKSNGDIRDMTK